LFQLQITTELVQRKIAYIPLRGSLEERMERVAAALRVYNKYRNTGELWAL
jgi:HTH-type transcriptional repressor of NAD biosynthesis genes